MVPDSGIGSLGSGSPGFGWRTMGSPGSPGSTGLPGVRPGLPGVAPGFVGERGSGSLRDAAPELWSVHATPPSKTSTRRAQGIRSDIAMLRSLGKQAGRGCRPLVQPCAIGVPRRGGPEASCRSEQSDSRRASIPVHHVVWGEFQQAFSLTSSLRLHPAEGGPCDALEKTLVETWPFPDQYARWHRSGCTRMSESRGGSSETGRCETSRLLGEADVTEHFLPIEAGHDAAVG